MEKKHKEKYRFQLSSPLLNNINENQTLLFINFSSSDSPSSHMQIYSHRIIDSG